MMIEDESPIKIPPDGTIDGDGVWRDGKWHPKWPSNHAVDHRPLIERLRSGFGGLVPTICDEAANELERLTAMTKSTRLGIAEIDPGQYMDPAEICQWWNWHRKQNADDIISIVHLTATKIRVYYRAEVK
jgi:hypothetical protein